MKWQSGRSYPSTWHEWAALVSKGNVEVAARADVEQVRIALECGREGCR